MATFRSSRAAVVELASRYKTLINQTETQHEAANPKSEAEVEQAERTAFTEICEISLWGNVTDLSHWPNLTHTNRQALLKGAHNILVNDLPAAFQVLKTAQRNPSSSDQDRRVDIILDNAGLELLADLLLAAYLLSANLATTVILHPKSIPWFVSDVVEKDFADLLDALAEEPGPELAALSSHLRNLHVEGRIALRLHRFWTTADTFWRLPPDLLDDLRSSELVIFKGDLNYAKLVADAKWDPTTPFAEAIGPLGREGSGVRVLALRTCKADVVVGLPAGRDEELGPGRQWAWGGEWAVVQFWDGKV
ncbi:MAG: hypothetical protein Q9195_006114 [Heterodermia aff. obscurata]